MLGRLDAPILPGRELGGIEVGIPLRLHSEELLRAELRGEATYRMGGIFEVNYLLKNGALELGVDVRNGKIARVTAASGYIGMLGGGIRIGMTAGEVMAMNKSLYYDELHELILSRDTQGLSLEVAEVDPPPEIVPSLKVVAITVYHPILDTRAGQTGTW